jgi:phenylalanine ammonia-lyase
LTLRPKEGLAMINGTAVMSGVAANCVYDARRCLSQATVALYEALREIVERAPDVQRPYIRNHHEQSLSDHVLRIDADIEACGRIPAAVDEMLTSSTH